MRIIRCMSDHGLFLFIQWVAKQREQYKLYQRGKHSFLTPDRLEKLNSIGFVWAVRGDVVDFDEPPMDDKSAAEDKVTFNAASV